MVWRESCAMDERVRFIADRSLCLWTMTELCERYEISRKTGYKWLERYRHEGAAGLRERPHAPHRHGRATALQLVDALIGLPQERPRWGPRGLLRSTACPGRSAPTMGRPLLRRGPSGLTALSVWWIKLGIRHERIDPGCPQQNGRHERFHPTLLEAMRPTAADRAEQARRFLHFARDYNEERPHEALGQRTPASVYRPSSLAMPAKLAEPAYPAEAAARKVRSNGEIKWQGNLIHISSAQIGEAVAVEETSDGAQQVRFFEVPHGLIDPPKGRLRPPPAKTGSAREEIKS